MEPSNQFRIQAPKVISETIDGETIIINLESGHYFSLNHGGGQIWNDIQAGLSVGQIVELTSRRYPDAGAQALPATVEFIESLLREGLVVAAEASPSSNALAVGGPNGPFEKPAIQKYEDMQDLLLLDPIHEVDEMGWPLTK